MNGRLTTGILLALTLLATGCDLLSDDLSDCPTDEGVTCRIYFSFAGGNASDIDPQDVKHLSLYVFDRNGYYVTYIPDEDPRLDTDDYCITLTLDDDDEYMFVAWGNVSPDYGYTLDDPADGAVEMWNVRLDDTEAEHLLYGCMQPSAETRALTQDYVIELYQNSYNIELTTEGFPDPEDDYTLELTNSFGGYSFLNEIILSEANTYLTPCERDEAGQPRAVARTHGLEAGTNTTVALTKGAAAERLFEDDLVSLISEANRQGAAIDFRLVHNFTIHLKYDPATLEVEVSINGWNITHEYHELG
ncbi:MAG: FimB/Mfa2 family fimbrial subunit [Rikenellaceae bacterium]|nr:FimB/Mfa2 family fimbrial subunit [Rikenellaceae bacterium]